MHNNKKNNNKNNITFILNVNNEIAFSLTNIFY